MLQFLHRRSTPACDGTNRRDFLKVGALGMGGLMLPDLLRARAQASAEGRATRNTSVVWLWLGGGPTHVETFDPKMTAPVEFRSTTGEVRTNIAGVTLGGTFERMGQVADKMAFVRSFAHRNSGHGGGTHFVNTGYDFAGADQGLGQTKPSYGSILARHRGATNTATGLPNYVKLSNIGADGPSWLGASYAAFDVAGRARQNMALTVDAERMNDRRSMMRAFDDFQRDTDRTGLVSGLDAFEGQAHELLVSRARETFDVTRENARTLERYGADPLARNMLLARRLCESGVGFVTMNFGGWDMHGNIETAMRRNGPIVDRAVSAFVADVAERGLSDNILLVITGEFGRTPRINNNAGRDHWAPLSTLALSGGGLKMGQVVGESTAKAETPKSRPIGPQDLMATVFHVLGMPQDLHYTAPTGRPTPMLNGGRPIPELV